MQIKFNVVGMTCAACSARVEKVVSAIDGVEKVEVNLLKGSMIVYAHDDTISYEIISAVKKAGYLAQLTENAKEQKADSTEDMKSVKLRLILSFVFLAILMYFSMGHMVGLPVPHWYHGAENAVTAALLQLMLTLPVLYLNRNYFINGTKAIVHGGPNMDSLIAVGSFASFAYSIASLFIMSYAAGHGDMVALQYHSMHLYFESAAMILTLVSLGKYLEKRAKGKTGDAISALMELNPKNATVIRNSEHVLIPISEVVVGDIVVIRSGNRIPVDGVIVEGRGSVDQSALTGESIPVDKAVGDRVSAATINTEGYFLVRAEKVGTDTTFSQIIRLVEHAGGSKAPIARLADKVAGVFVPVVMAISVVTFAGWLIGGYDLSFAFSRAVAVLVISCPCALGLATPVAIMVATGRGASMGVLYKNAEVLEKLHNVNIVVFDKTGTLTQGHPEVTHVIPSSIGEERLLQLAASLEAKSEHLFAKAILRRWGEAGLLDSTEFQTLPGQGVSAKIDGKIIYGGNAALMQDLNISVPDMSEYTDQGMTPLFFALSDTTYLGCILVADVLKPDSVDAINKLKSIGIQTVMLTGDNKQTALSIAQKAGIQHVISDVLPADKADTITSLQKNGDRVLMVGDGINDAPALATAYVGMAIGSGTDIAVESSDVVLMNPSIVSVSDAILLSRSTIKNIRQNLFWAFFYNVVGIPIAAGALYPLFGLELSPMLGAAAMSLSSLFVVSNALRLRFFKTKQIEKQMEEKTMEFIIHVDGMMCSHCKARVEETCKAINGVQDAVVDLQQKEVKVTGNASIEEVKKAITDAGYKVID